jgi:hypothetical protein
MVDINYPLIVIEGLVGAFFLFQWGKGRKNENLALGLAFTFILGMYVLFDLVLQLSAPTFEQTMANLGTTVFILLGGIGFMVIMTNRHWIALVIGTSLIGLMVAMIAVPLVVTTLPAYWVFTSSDGLLRISVPLVFLGLMLYGIMVKYQKKSTPGILVGSLLPIGIGVLSMIAGFTMYYLAL